VVPTDGTAAIREERGDGIAASTPIVPPPVIAKSKASELTTWLAPIRAAFEEHGATWYAKPDGQLIALHKRGISAQRVVRAARVMFAAYGLHSPSPRMLGAQWERWDGEATAAERWDIYKRHDLATIGTGDYEARIAEAVKAGAWSDEDEARREIEAVRPYDIARLNLGREDNIREVAKRLAAA